jgi:type I restriction enzyme M protein
MLDPAMKAKIDKLWNMFWSGGLSNPLTAIEQMSYLIFMKRLEDLDNVNRMRSQARKEKHRSILSGHDDCKWSNWKHMNAEAMYEHVSKVVFPFIKNLRNGEEALYSRYMRDATFMIPKASLLQEAVSIIDEIEIGERPDIQGDIYEHVLGELKTAGKNGQFRTPRHIIRMMVELVDPDIGQKICDPACGTGGFLIAAYQHILRKYTALDMVKEDPDGTPHNLIGNKIVKKEHWKLLWDETFFGYDFDITMIRIALMNMILHGITQPNIDQKDTLSKQFSQKSAYDMILANPPFAGYVDKGDISDKFSLDTTKTELLFVELFHNLLVVGGKAAVIVPNGVLFGSSGAHIKARKILLERCDLQAVISMAPGFFQPYSGVGTAVLVFVKGGKTENVWFYDMKEDGYSVDLRRDFIDGKGEIPDVISKFRGGRLESEKSVLVPFEAIKENDYNLSVSRYKEVVPANIKYKQPETLIDETLRIEEGIVQNLKDLKKMI